MDSSSPRRVGVLVFWHLSSHGGFGHVLIPSTQERFFIHRSFIKSGQPLVGSSVSFVPAPPIEGKIYPQATQAIIDNTRIVQATKTAKAGLR